jgi:hypothetical protein
MAAVRCRPAAQAGAQQTTGRPPLQDRHEHGRATGGCGGAGVWGIGLIACGAGARQNDRIQPRIRRDCRDLPGALGLAAAYAHGRRPPRRAHRGGRAERLRSIAEPPFAARRAGAGARARCRLPAACGRQAGCARPASGHVRWALSHPLLFRASSRPTRKQPKSNSRAGCRDQSRANFRKGAALHARLALLIGNNL